MTLIAAFVTDKFILFASDRRRTSVEDNREFYDDMRKIYRINEEVIVGGVGDGNHA
jgi:hypothetical protein